jgi:hypothetical protein
LTVQQAVEEIKLGTASAEVDEADISAT